MRIRASALWWDRHPPPCNNGWRDVYETWTYASADDPTFTFTIVGDYTNDYSEGMKIKLTQTTVKYFIITKVAYSAPNTTVTIYGGTDYDLANATITDPQFSTDRAPFGFPMNPEKWRVRVANTSNESQALPVALTWYNLGAFSISIPIGTWYVDYQVSPYVWETDTRVTVYTTLSNANNTEFSKYWTTVSSIQCGSAALMDIVTVHRSGIILATTKQQRYLNTMTPDAAAGGIGNYGDEGYSVITAVCAYL
jgi:hypothetical protein